MRPFSRKFLTMAAATMLVVLFWLLAGQRFGWLQRMTDGHYGWDFHIYLDAYAKAAAGSNPYQPYDIGRSFLNHPFLLTFITPFAWLSNQTAATWLWILASLIAWIFSVGLALHLGHSFYSADDHFRFPSRLLWLLLLGFAPAVETLYMGQVNAFVLVLLLTAIWFCENERPMAAGFCLAGAIALKTSPAFFLLAFVALRGWRVVTAALVFLALLTLLSAVQFQTRLVIWYAELFARLNTEIHTSPYNFSPLSLLYQLLAADRPLAAVTAHLLYWFGLVTVVAVLLLLAWRQQAWLTARQRGEIYAVFTVLMVMASPLFWYHHALFLLLPIALLSTQNRLMYAITVLILLLIIQSERVIALLPYHS